MPAPLCDVCGTRPSLYVCQDCGKRACQSCFIPENGLCSGCATVLQETAGRAAQWNEFGPILILAGFALAFIGALAVFLAVFMGGGDASGGLVIFIGPIPIVLGFGTQGLPLLAVALTIAGAIMLALLLRLGPRASANVLLKSA